MVLDIVNDLDVVPPAIENPVALEVRIKPLCVGAINPTKNFFAILLLNLKRREVLISLLTLYYLIDYPTITTLYVTPVAGATANDTVTTDVEVLTISTSTSPYCGVSGPTDV